MSRTGNIVLLAIVVLLLVVAMTAFTGLLR